VTFDPDFKVTTFFEVEYLFVPFRNKVTIYPVSQKTFHYYFNDSLTSENVN